MRNSLLPTTFAFHPGYSRRALSLAVLSGLAILLANRAVAQIPDEAQRVAQNSVSLTEASEHGNGRLVERQTALYEELSKNLAALQMQSAVLRQIVYVVRPSVVHIIADKKPPAGESPAYDRYTEQYSDPDDGSQMPPDAYVEEAGSGVVIEVDGKTYVLTNRHVIRDATIDHIHVEFANGRRTVPSRKWSDESTDVALLEISDRSALPARLGDSGNVEMGDLVLAIGSPFGLNHSVTQGIISAKGRRDLVLGIDDVRIQDFLQTDAAINPGNSGGPLINMRGEVIGLNTAIASNSGGNEGIGFSIPMNMAVHVARQLVTHGSLRRPYLGVRLDHAFSANEAQKIGLPRRMGTRITDVSPGSPADRAELKSGDVIVKFNEVEIEDDGHLVNLVGLSPLGTKAPLSVYRKGNYVPLVVSIETRDKDATATEIEPADVEELSQSNPADEQTR